MGSKIVEGMSIKIFDLSGTRMTRGCGRKKSCVAKPAVKLCSGDDSHSLDTGHSLVSNTHPHHASNTNVGALLPPPP